MASFENLKAWQALIVSTKSEPAFSQNPLSAALPGVDLGIPEGKREKLRLRSSPLAIRIVFTVGRVALTGCLHCLLAWNWKDIFQTNGLKRRGIPRMMTKKMRLLPLGFVISAATALALTALPASAQSALAQSAPAKAAPAPPAQTPIASPYPDCSCKG